MTEHPLISFTNGDKSELSSVQFNTSSFSLPLSLCSDNVQISRIVSVPERPSFELLSNRINARFSGGRRDIDIQKTLRINQFKLFSLRHDCA